MGDILSEFRLIQGDCLDVLKTLDENSIDACVCDPPYGLSFMGKAWDKGVPSVDVWREVLRVLKPGGHLLAFAGTRTQHRMASAIEDAGFEIRDMIAWVYGSGFPKSLDVSKAIDKAAGAEREVVGQKVRGDVEKAKINGSTYAIADANKNNKAIFGYGVENITAPATEAAQQWQGWGTALKPALEPITVARKPLTSPYTNVLYMIESQLRDRGVTGEIIWEHENAKDAAKLSKTINSGLTKHSGLPETYAKNVEENERPRTEQKTPINTKPLTQNGERGKESTSESTRERKEKNYASKSFQHMEGNVPAAESVNKSFLPSTTLTGEGQSIERRSTEKFTKNSEGSGSRKDIECFAGIATGLTGSMAIVRIIRNYDGAFIWPKDLPKSVPGKKLTVAANVLEWGTGAINVDGCRVEAPDHPGIHRSMSNNLHEGYQRPWRDGGPPQYKDTPQGRWPANFAHDGSDEVVGLFPVTTSGGGNRNGAQKGDVFHGVGDTGTPRPFPASTGSAARFFKSCELEDTCHLCLTPKHDIVSEWKSILALTAEKNGWTSQATNEFIARVSAMRNRNERLVQNVKSAGSLCGSCATSIAVALVGIKTSAFSSEELQVILGYIKSYENSILIQSLVSFAELWENTDTTPTTKSLSILFGYVHLATESYTKQESKAKEEGDSDPEGETPYRFKYSPKASKRDRDEGCEGMPEVLTMRYSEKAQGPLPQQTPSKPVPQRNHHPTVKPTDLMRYLVRLVTPPGGTVLDPYTGSGSTGKACMYEGFDFVGVEIDPEYVEIARARIVYTRAEVRD